MATGRSLSRTIDGVGLHSGAKAAVTVRVWDGPTAFKAHGSVLPVRSLHVSSTQRSTTLSNADKTFSIATVEHLFAALAARGGHHGCLIEVDGPELPLLDGAAAQWCAALDTLSIPAAPPSCVVEREGEVAVGESRFRFSPATGARASVSVDFQTDHPMLSRSAAWDGSYEDFALRFAAARTFVSESDLRAFLPGNLASHAPPETVVVLTENDVLFRGAPFQPDEPARHKLLDLVGDLFVTGGPPVGHVHAIRPGHGANRAAVAKAFDLGILVERP